MNEHNVLNRYFTLKHLLLFWDIHTSDMWNVCLQIFGNNRSCSKLSCFLRNLQTSMVNDSRIFRIKNARVFRILFLHPQKHIGRFSNLHQCTFRVNESVYIVSSTYRFCWQYAGILVWKRDHVSSCK